MWTPVPGYDGDFWPRRFAHEALVHRADAALALGVPFAAEADVAADAIDEWMELGSLPMMLDAEPALRELLGRDGRSTSTPPTAPTRNGWSTSPAT